MVSSSATLRDVQGAASPELAPCCAPCSEYAGSTFAEVWGQVKSDPYTALPTENVGVRRFFRKFSYLLANAGRRTVSTNDDLLPRFDKLIRPNGLCLSGQWEIDTETPYTGLLATGARASVVARASVAMKETRRGAYRSFGMAAKLFPVSAEARVDTANFFVIDDNGGTRTEDFLDARMSTHPPFSLNRSSLFSLPTFVAIAVAQRLADSNTGSRQLYPLSRSGLKDPEVAKAPKFLMVRGVKQSRTRLADFRDDLRVLLQRGPLEFEVLAREDKAMEWRKIGRMRFTSGVASDSCDHRLHFAHPRWIRETAQK